MNLVAIAATVLAMTSDSERPNPIEAFIVWSRGELQRTGLTRKTTDSGSVYWTGGARRGKTLVLLHGANDQAGTWALVVPELKRDYRLIVPDLAGHGESEPKSGPITFGPTVQRLDEIIKREARGKVTIAGNSMGGWIAMLYALEHPEKVERLVLEDSGGMAWKATVSLLPTTREGALAAMRAAWGPDYKPSDDLLDALINRKNTPISRMDLGDVLGHILDSRFHELKPPVSLIWGRDDGILPLDYAKALQEKIPGSTLSIIDGAAHIPHRQQPSRFVQCLKGTC
jgi:pimeloyl-ACP methyl ester carboxylesterase